MDEPCRPVSLDEVRRRKQELQPPNRLPKRGVRRAIQRIADYAEVDADALAHILKTTE
ncbi:MAG: hypothetical protein AB7R89_28685 [Dehalococcoidia bacterium]